jgi:hypothetical protein
MNTRPKEPWPCFESAISTPSSLCRQIRMAEVRPLALKGNTNRMLNRLLLLQMGVCFSLYV